MQRRDGTLKFKYPFPDWDDIRIFIVCAEYASFRKAAEGMGMDPATIMRRIKRLEDRFAVRLFHRLPDGIQLTSDGKAVLADAQLMQKSSYAIAQRLSNRKSVARGIVRVAVTEGLGAFWLMPRLVGFQQKHPDFVIDMRCGMENVDVLRLEADLAIQFSRPQNPNQIVTKLGTLHGYPFASKRYVDLFGLPKSLDDMDKHRIIDQTAPQIGGSIWEDVLGKKRVDQLVTMKTNSSTALLYAVEKGGGIAGLPSYAPALGAELVPVDIGLHKKHEIWLTFTEQAPTAKRLRTTIDWLKQSFDPTVFPWFRDDFIHPSDLVGMVPNGARVNFGGGFASVAPPTIQPGEFQHLSDRVKS